jgi:hypothetical protein
VSGGGWVKIESDRLGGWYILGGRLSDCARLAAAAEEVDL